MQSSATNYFKVLFFSYLLFSFSGIFPKQSPFIALAEEITITGGTVLEPPVQPILSGEALCNDGKLTVHLDWPTDINTETFDIKRNEGLLATNIIPSNYTDSDIKSGITYIYQVIAHGPMGPGSATSEELTILTPTNCDNAEQPPVQKITVFENKPIEDYNGTLQTKERRPSFSGKTNIPNAKIEIVVDGSPKIYQTIVANSNGFWTWQSSEILDYGFHTISVTAIDPNDPAHAASDNFPFEILKKSSDDETKKKDASEKKDKPPIITSSYIPDEVSLLEKSSQNSPFLLSITIENFNHLVFIGEKLSLHIDFSKKTPLLEDKEYQVFYEIINAQNEIIAVDSEYINILKNDNLVKKIPISALAPLGEYRIRIKAYDGKTLIAGENFFTIKELPLINIGFCTISLGQIIQNYSWILLTLLIAFLFLIRKEHRRSEQGIYQMTGKYLKKSGFFSNKND
ncbi:MAG: Ig-like domain-containing protein [Parcubacteria group bacterium]|jgi:hypothetical protein